MAPGHVAEDFNAIINAGRRQKNQALAQELLGSDRRSSAPGPGLNDRKARTGPSLASRVGITKRSSTSNIRLSSKPTSLSRLPKGNVDADWTHDLHSLNNPSTSLALPRSKKLLPTRTEQLYTAFSSNSNNKNAKALNEQVNIVKSSSAKSFSIKGLAGPYTVIAKNFAPGTTAADIESAMVQVGGTCLECKLIATRPSIIAEMVFETKEGADAVVETFNKQEADGNVLHVYHKTTPTSTTTNAGSAAQASTARSTAAPSGRRGTDDSRLGTELDRYGTRRKSSARDNVVDEIYGFEDRMDTDDVRGNSKSQKLYSDDLVGAWNDRDRGRNGDQDRGRGYDGWRGRY